MTQGERVRNVRKELGLTLEKFGKRIGLKKSGLSQIENGINDSIKQKQNIFTRRIGLRIILS